nr:hypothetical protein [Mycoplasma capricolum]
MKLVKKNKLLNKQKEKLDADISTYFQKKKDLEDKRYLLINQISNLKKQIEEENLKIRKREEELEELSNKYLEKQNQIRDLKEENKRLESSINELNSRYEYLKKKTVEAEYDGNKCIKIGFFIIIILKNIKFKHLENQQMKFLIIYQNL